ncbi:hypothetical protein Adt_24398 [Abeliophyllum distichum]|uniref:Transmembrane protein n=1 Tax=Abeliophyllum distichum TaxID=126358 RepID=A0ABD1SGF2_9LAMI
MNPTSFHIIFSRTHFLESPKLPFLLQNSDTQFPNSKNFSTHYHLLPMTKVRASFQEPYGNAKKQNSSNGSTSADFNLDEFLSIIEFLCLAASAAISVYIFLNSVTQKSVIGWLGNGNKILVWQFVALVSGVIVGAVIRGRQWRRICGVGFLMGSASMVNLMDRVDKLEEGLRSSATIIRVLSMQLEKLGIRFRVIRKALKEPIAETAALAQKNSEATQALAVQDDILEKELGEIQKVLLAMQEQQQKQLELILAIGENWEVVGEQTLTALRPE